LLHFSAIFVHICIKERYAATASQAQGIEAEFAKRSEANWSGKPDPAFGGGAPKNQKGKPDIKPNAAPCRVCQSPFSDQKHGVKSAYSRVCKPPFSDLTARSKKTLS
jgi:hypothetical protein